jgi:hypothetical protein
LTERDQKVRDFSERIQILEEEKKTHGIKKSQMQREIVNLSHQVEEEKQRAEVNLKSKELGRVKKEMEE